MVLERARELFGDVEYGFDTTLSKALPVTCIVLITNPDVGDDLDWSITIRDRGRLCLIFAIECYRGGWGQRDYGSAPGGRMECE